ncbi:MAG: hypothetical protein H6533_01715 [Thermoleophilales bacterium]|nr:hypothetical protein [Thermoleophilales bacterium]
MNADELFDLLEGMEGSRDAGSGSGVDRSRLVTGVEYALAPAVDERKLRASWKRRQGGGPVPLVLITAGDNGGPLRVLGPAKDGPLRSVRADSLAELIKRTTGMGELESQRFVAAEIDRLDSERVAGVVVRGLGTEHLMATRLPRSQRWPLLQELRPADNKTEWRDALTDLGYSLERLPHRGWLARYDGRAVLLIHPKGSASEFARLDEGDRLPEGALLADCERHGAPYGLLASGSRMRLLRATGEEGGQATRFLELDAALIEQDRRPLLGLLSPAYLADGEFASLMEGPRPRRSLRLRLDRSSASTSSRFSAAGSVSGRGERSRHRRRRRPLRPRAAASPSVRTCCSTPRAGPPDGQPRTSSAALADRAARPPKTGSADAGSTSLWDDIKAS